MLTIICASVIGLSFNISLSNFLPIFTQLQALESDKTVIEPESPEIIEQLAKGKPYESTYEREMEEDSETEEIEEIRRRDYDSRRDDRSCQEQNNNECWQYYRNCREQGNYEDECRQYYRDCQERNNYRNNYEDECWQEPRRRR